MQLKPLGIGVSVLCPSFVRTRIGESGRNRPERYGQSQPLDPASPAAAMVAEIARQIEAGLDPDYRRRARARPPSGRMNSTFSPIPACGPRWSRDFAAILAAMDRVAGPIILLAQGLMALFLRPNDARHAPADRRISEASRHVDMDQLKRQAAAQALEHVQDGMKLGLGTGSTAKHFVELLGEKVAGGMNVIGVPTSEATRAQAEALQNSADHARCDRPARSHRGRRRRDRSRAQPDQGRRRRAVAGEDRGGGLGSHDRDCRRYQMGRCSRPFPPTCGGDSVRAGRDPAGHGRRHLRKAAFPGKWGSARARTATFLSPMAATGLSMPISGASRMRRVWRAC